MTNLTLYEIIKQKSKEKGRPLKIICDWDECLQPLNPWVENEAFVKRENFKDFFIEYWEKAEKTFRSHGTAKSNTNIPEIESSQKQNPHEHKKKYARVKSDHELYEKSPFLSIAEELLQALKEDLISDLLIISSFREGLSDYTPENFDPVRGDKRKIRKFQNTFGKFPVSRLKISKFQKGLEHGPGQSHPYRWEVIKEECPNFDLFIDDNNVIISKTREYFANYPDKIYLSPAYKTNFSSAIFPDYQLVKTTVSDITTADFEKAAEEYKAKKAQKQSQKEPKNYWPWIIGGVIVAVLFFLGLVRFVLYRKRKK